MKGVGPEMILSVSTLAAVACQGCQSNAGFSYAEPLYPYEVSSNKQDRAAPDARATVPEAGIAPLPAKPDFILRTDSSFSLTQSQTVNTDSISITPILGKDALDANIGFNDGFTGTRLSQANAVVDFEGARKSANLVMPVRSVREFDASLSLSANNAQTGLGFDVGVVPRVSVRKDGQFKTRRFGGEIRIGQNFDQRGKDVDAKSWYLFAGADGEALIYEPYHERSWTNSLAMRDQVTVGDMQAGVSFTQGGGQLSLSYIRREVSYSERGVSGEENEDFMGVSFTLRR